ncbi:MAG: hypothetical protein EZS28_026499 [Streblomastix strix]|uniref:Uncharacterized protein n=1 Tax=Streblomastix strix TaxID=222440 RepID=A0A5J4V6E0_9EUKA|nr:MAG: hypothetical protein EZS28_026499 [Streblomastix strix]
MVEMAIIDLSVSIIDDQEHTEAVCIPPNNLRKERDIIIEEQKILECVQQRYFLFVYQDLENTSNRVHQNSYTYSELKIETKLIRNSLAHVLNDLFRQLEYKMQLQTPLDLHHLPNQQHRVLIG